MLRIILSDLCSIADTSKKKIGNNIPIILPNFLPKIVMLYCTIFWPGNLMPM